MFSMMQAAKIVDEAFPWLSEEEATNIITAYVWGVYVKQECMLTEFDILRVKSIIMVWLSESNDDAKLQVFRQLNLLS